MEPDDAAVALDRHDFDGDDSDTFGLDASPAAPGEAVADPDVVVDDDLLEVDLGELDAPLIIDEEEMDDDILDPLEEEDEDDLEISLLQEFGIDLDAPDTVAASLDIGLGADDESDDEVAA